jgi:general secretion pathway protein D
MLKKSFIVATSFLAALVAVPARAGADDPAPGPPIICANGLIGGVNCSPTKESLKEARKAFDRGLKLHGQQHLEQALAQFDEAVRLAPQNTKFLTAREVVKAKLVFDHIESGNRLLGDDARLRAAGEFRAALDLDPDNQFAQERLEEAMRLAVPVSPGVLPDRLADSQEIQLEPSDDRATFHFTGDTRSLFNQLAAAYKMNVQFDDSVKQREVRFNVDNVDFLTALKLASETSKSMWVALNPHQFFIAEDTPENHRQYDRMSLRTFVLPPHATVQEAQDVVNTMRTMFDLHFISPGQTSGTVEVRGPQAALEGCAQLIEQLDHQSPQVMVNVRVFQISHELTRDMGVHIPYTFNLYNIPTAALAGLAGQNIQQLINQLISSGGINQAGSTSLAGLLSQLTGQQNNIFSQPLATFGGGLTFMGLSLDQLAFQMSLNESWVRQLDDLQIRAGQTTEPATFHLGERYPVLNASYAPIYNSPQISQVLGNQSYVPPIPSVSYEDLGLQVKVKPMVHGDGNITLQLDMQVRSLTGQSTNGVPVISNREYQGSITLRDGEPAFVAGMISHSDMLSMSGVPGLGAIPLLNKVSMTTKQVEDDELMVAITPHVLSNFDRRTTEIWLSEN